MSKDQWILELNTRIPRQTCLRLASQTSRKNNFEDRKTSDSESKLLRYAIWYDTSLNPWPFKTTYQIDLRVNAYIQKDLYMHISIKPFHVSSSRTLITNITLRESCNAQPNSIPIATPTSFTVLLSYSPPFHQTPQAPLLQPDNRAQLSRPDLGNLSIRTICAARTVT